MTRLPMGLKRNKLANSLRKAKYRCVVCRLSCVL